MHDVKECFRLHLCGVFDWHILSQLKFAQFYPNLKYSIERGLNILFKRGLNLL